MKKIFLAIIFLASCSNSDRNDNNQNRVQLSDTGSGNNRIISVDLNQEKNIPSPVMQPKAEQGLLTEKNLENDIRFKTFKNDSTNGFGYDIIVDGKSYIHQPNIPAKSGNDGFENERQAAVVAKLVVNKIKHNILPPTVSMEELDSLGIKNK